MASDARLVDSAEDLREPCGEGDADRDCFTVAKIDPIPSWTVCESCSLKRVSEGVPIVQQHAAVAFSFVCRDDVCLQLHARRHGVDKRHLVQILDAQEGVLHHLTET